MAPDLLLMLHNRAVTTYFYTASAATGEVDTYRLTDAAGSLERVATASAGVNLSAIVTDPERRRLYVADRTMPAIVTFAIGPDGTLAKLNAAFTSSPLANLCLSANRTTMYGVSYTDGTACAHPVDGDGLVLAAGRLSLELGADARCHDVVEVGEGHLVVSALGHDLLYRVRHDAEEGVLEQAPPPVRNERNSGPRHLWLSPARDELYVIGERDARITAHPLTPGGTRHDWYTVPSGIELAPGIVRTPGAVTPATDPASGLPFTWAADLTGSPDGRLLFSTERSSSTVSVTSAATGRLLAWAATEPQPRGIALDPSGRFLLVTGELSSTVSLFEVAPGGGLRFASHAPAREGLLWAEAMIIPNGSSPTPFA
jgi:6-phosphogluconolactonase